MNRPSSSGCTAGPASTAAGRPAAPLRRALRAWSPVLVLVAASAALAIGGDPVRQWARYERRGIEAGQLWRLVTGHLVHLGPGHLLLDLGALVLIRLIVGTALSATEWAGAALASAAAIDAGLYFGARDVAWYVGLSGVLHGLLAAGAVALLRLDRSFAVVLGVGLAAKLAWEQTVGPLPWSVEATGGPVITAAHLYGAAGGAIFGAAAAYVRRRRAAPL